ncbi:hypothetical protein DICPUDRAFT_149906 [Dictyostelium purpureum]|uniref:Exportin-4 n=1 Tax=Dictyostelium purpureum TaxID=5786 RepID=F0ZEY7_DICPU|nr:uncharacterized protein DICPUDRAFT_149906 [Dictyostelium purpureum]EGC37512.1 hypothetical protein DICPUDRAFT_149906 [Dictyostelium purpureum]|eukprot:XP_003285986.1 hypothetical protein DICPUDRAFT_149906 [Dictyostelium purpureum]
MEIEFINKLEKACLDLTSQKNEQRKNGEESISMLMKTPQPYSLCFNLLAKSTSTFAHFYSLLMIRDSAVREWAALESSLKIFIIETLFQYIENQKSMNFLNYATKNQSFNTLGVVCKRGWLDTDKFNGNQELNQIIMEKVYQYLDSSINSFSPDTIDLSIRIVSSLIIEFSSGSKAAHIQLSWEFHQKCLLTFQNLHLQPAFRKIMELLHKFQNHIQQQQSLLNDKNFTSLLHMTIKCFTDILDWRFLESGSPTLAYITSFSTVQPNLKPTMEWAQLFTQSPFPVLTLIFSLYRQLENLEKVPSLLRHCMNQCCGLTGIVIRDAGVKDQYLKELLGYLTPMIQKAITTRNWREMEDVSNIIYKFCNAYKFSSLLVLPNELVLPFLRYTTEFVFSSLTLMKIWAKHGEEELEEEFENDCFSILLKAFVALISDADIIVSRRKSSTFENFTEQFTCLKQCTAQIYQTYVQSRLELSEIELNKDSDQLEPSAVQENEIDEDKHKYEEQLKSVAYIGRLNPGQSMDLLKNEINKRISLLKERISDPVIFEHLHWLFIFSGHLLFDSENKTLSAIPNAIEDYTFQLSSENPNAPDSVVELSNAVFRFGLEYENPLLKNNQADKVSPLVSQTSLWFLSGWSLVYLLPSKSLNVRVSPKILEAYGSEQSVSGIADYLVDKVLFNLKCWSGDIDVLKATSVLLNCLCSNKDFCKFLVKTNNWPKLFYLEGLQEGQLTPSVYGQLYQAFNKVVFSFSDDNKKQYYMELVKTMVEQFDSVLGRPDFTKISQDARVKENIYILLEKLNGIVSVSESLFVEDVENSLFLTLDLFTKYANALIAMIPLYDHCNDVVLLILRLFSNLTKNQLEFLTEPRAKQIYPFIIQLFNSVSSTSSHKKSLDSKEYYSRIKMMVKILFNIITFNDQSNNCPNLIAETTFYGINIITPCLTNNDLLLFPKLARNYFIITTFLFGSESIQVKDIPQINTIYSLIEAGILHHDLEIVKGCFECIVSLTKNLETTHEKTGAIDQHYHQVIIQFIGSVINFLLLQDFNVDDLLASASETLFALMCSSPDGYRSKVIDLITRQDSSIQNRVAQQFETLTITGKDRKSKEAFNKRLQQFLVNVKPLISKK